MVAFSKSMGSWKHILVADKATGQYVRTKKIITLSLQLDNKACIRILK